MVNETNQRGKLQYEHYLMSYGSVNYGFSTVNKNYKVPVSALREDFKGYIGFENAKGGWRQLTRLWYGEWYRTKETFVKNGDDMEKITVGDKVNSYLYKWSDSEIGQDDYICNKFGDELDDNGKNYDKVPTDRIFIIKNAPIPCEYNFATSFVKRDEEGNPIQDKDGNYEYETYDCDPYPQFAKIVDKEYIDNRFNGIRVIDVSDTVEEIIEEAAIQPYTEDGEIDTSIRDFLIKPEWKSILKIRPYTCIYDYTNFKIDDGQNPIPLIDIWDNLDDGTGKTTKELLNERKEKSLIFYIKLSKPVFKDGERHKGILIAANSNFASRYFNYNEKDADGNDLKDENGNIIVTNGYEHYYSPYTVWAFPGERHEIFNNAREAQRDVLIKVQCSYDDDGNLNLVCTNAFNYEPGTSNMTVFDRYISDSISDKSSNKVPSSKSLYNHIFGT
ncbi:MAG: hypothetical protein J6R59_01320 [Paludibacteraceae bacterium]|nr:hypothetical protein [Paludibacteraceae bacterium]